MVKKFKRATTVQTAKKKLASSATSKKLISQKATKTKPEPINSSVILLDRGKGSKGRGGDKGGQYWHIYVNNTRAGFVFINWIDEKPFGKHASIQIKINNDVQNRGIGRVAYRTACEKSQYNTVFAHMSKSNIASQKAAHAAGFEVVTEYKIAQLVMVWKRFGAE